MHNSETPSQLSLLTYTRSSRTIKIGRSSQKSSVRAHHHRPYQLLLPPGLCKLVCPIFTTPASCPCPFSPPANSGEALNPGDIFIPTLDVSTASSNGLLARGPGEALRTPGDAMSIVPEPLTRGRVDRVGEGGAFPPPAVPAKPLEGVPGMGIGVLMLGG